MTHHRRGRRDVNFAQPTLQYPPASRRNQAALGGALIGMQSGVSHARVVVDRHEKEHPACAVYAVAAVAGHPVAGPLDPRPSFLVSMCSGSSAS
jgi:hypothetical protein